MKKLLIISLLVTVFGIPTADAKARWDDQLGIENAPNCKIRFECDWEFIIAPNEESACKRFARILQKRGYQLDLSPASSAEFTVGISRQFGSFGRSSDLEVSIYRSSDFTTSRIDSDMTLIPFRDLLFVRKSLKSISRCKN